LAVGGADEGVERTGRGEDPVHLDAADHVREPTESQRGLLTSVERREPRRERDRADRHGLVMVPHVEVDGVRRAHRHALPTLRAYPTIEAAVGTRAGVLLAHSALVLGKR